MRETIMMPNGMTEERAVSTTKRRPQVGTIHYEGQTCKVYIGFWGGLPMWKVAGASDQAEYEHCATRPMPIEDDPEYLGE